MLLLLSLALASAVDPTSSEPSARARSEEALSRYFTQDDYPDAAIRKDEEGTVRFDI